MTEAKQRRILVISHDPLLKMTRAAILKNEGYDVAAVETPEEALARLESERFDLVVLGRKAEGAGALGALLRERHPSLPILKIASVPDAVPDAELYAVHYVDPLPTLVIEAVRELLGC